MKGIVEIKCANCNKKIYVQKQYIREKMFCTLGCMDSYSVKTSERQGNW